MPPIPHPENRLRQVIARGDTAIGVWCSLGGPLATEVVASAGPDWVLIDCEHSPNQLLSIVPQLQTAAAYPVEAVVRLPSHDTAAIKQTMDAGARSLMFPNVRSAEEAASLVAAMRYAPNGVRGFSSSHRGNRFGRIDDYHRTAHEHQWLAAQIECADGLANAAAIAAVDGIDALFIGPGDLSANLGAMNNPGADHVQEAIQKIIGDAKAAGKAAGILAPAVDDARRYIGWGCNMAAVGSDLSILVRGVDQLVATFKD
ncbi:MAG: aldolase/citrate lyase family protein [Pseudomonadota bacterium]